MNAPEEPDKTAVVAPDLADDSDPELTDPSLIETAEADAEDPSQGGSSDGDS